MGCGCAAVLLGAMFPRVGLIIAWLFTDRVDLAFDGWALPVLGFIFLPFTTFFYVLAYAPIVGVHGVGWFFVTFGFLLDLSSYFGGERFNSRRRYRY